MYNTFDGRNEISRGWEGPRAMAGHVALVDRRFYKTIKFAPRGHSLLLFAFSFFFFSFLPSLLRISHAPWFRSAFNSSSEILGMLSWNTESEIRSLSPESILQNVSAIETKRFYILREHFLNPEIPEVDEFTQACFCIQTVNEQKCDKWKKDNKWKTYNFWHINFLVSSACVLRIKW